MKENKYKVKNFTIRKVTLESEEEVQKFCNDIAKKWQMVTTHQDTPNEILLIKSTNRVIVRPSESNITEKDKLDDVWYGDIPSKGEAGYFEPNGDVYYVRLLHHKGQYLLRKGIEYTAKSIVGEKGFTKGSKEIYGCGNDLLINDKKFFGDAARREYDQVIEVCMHTFKYHDKHFKSGLGPDYADGYLITGLENNYGKIDREKYWDIFIDYIVNAEKIDRTKEKGDI